MAVVGGNKGRGHAGGRMGAGGEDGAAGSLLGYNVSSVG